MLCNKGAGFIVFIMVKGGGKLKKSAGGKARPKPKKVNLKVRQIKNNRSVRKQASFADEKIPSRAEQRKVVTETIKRAESENKSDKKKSFFKKKSKAESINLLGTEKTALEIKRGAAGARSKGGKMKDNSRFIPKQNKNKTALLKENKKSGSGQEIDYIKLERDKRLILISGVTFFMVLISFFWIYNLKNTFRAKSPSETESLSNSDWSALTEDIGKSLEDMKAGLKQAKIFTDTATGTASTTKPVRLPENNEIGQASTTSKINEENINILKEKLERMKN